MLEMNNIPLIDESILMKIDSQIGQLFQHGKLPVWVNEKLAEFQQKNPFLHDYIAAHANSFGIAAVSTQSAQVISFSLVLELILLLAVLDEAINKQKEVQKFSENMDKLIKDKVKGLDDL